MKPIWTRLLLLAAGCVSQPELPDETGGPAQVPDDNRPPPGRAADLVAVVRRAFPHDPDAFTQGLVYHAGHLYESTGLEGETSLRRVDPDSGHVEQQVRLPAPLFGEGLARVGNRLIQLTWKDGRALVWELGSLWPLGEHRYTGEGWGLCHDGTRLVMSDGSDRLAFRDPGSFTRLGEVAVTSGGQPVRNLNELECVGGQIYANVWHLEQIARIDPRSGEVTAWLDASGLLPPDLRARVDVLNGIAFVPERGTFLLTGKHWPLTFEVEFVPRMSRSVRHRRPKTQKERDRAAARRLSRTR